jgi:hypothetical protein
MRGACYIWAAGSRVRIYIDAAPQRIASGPQYLCGRRTDHDGLTLSQVSVAVGQAEDCAALLAAAAWAGDGGLLGLRAAVLRISYAAGARRKLHRLCVVKREWPVGD